MRSAPFDPQSRSGSETLSFRKSQDTLSRLRPQLAVGLLEPTDTLIGDLNDVASLANSIAQWRSKGLKSIGGGHDAWKETIDALDRDGARSILSP